MFIQYRLNRFDFLVFPLFGQRKDHSQTVFSAWSKRHQYPAAWQCTGRQTFRHLIIKCFIKMVHRVFYRNFCNPHVPFLPFPDKSKPLRKTSAGVLLTFPPENESFHCNYSSAASSFVSTAGVSETASFCCCAGTAVSSSSNSLGSGSIISQR